MDKEELSKPDVEMLPEWRDEHKELVRALPASQSVERQNQANLANQCLLPLNGAWSVDNGCGLKRLL